MKTRDGVRLDADVYYPEDEGRFPVLLMRQPYGRAIASTVVYAHPTWYGSQGYIVVIQDVRGRGSSEGEFRLFAHEAEDGADAVAWAAQLPGSTGQVGMYGFSYQGMTQLYAAAAGAPALKALAPAMVGYDLYADWAYENGALLLQAGLGWAIQLAAETARLKGDEAAFGRLYAASRQLPLHGPVPARPQILAELAADSFFHDWLDHPQPDDYWQALKPDLSQVDLPMLHVGGWFDPYLRGTLRLYLEKAQGTTPQHLWIGPWGHLPWDRKVGAIDFGPKAVSPIDRLQIRWFDQFLKRKNSGILLDDPVSLFEMGTNQWRSFGAWPDLESQSNSGSNSGSDAGSDSESDSE
ncbi:MAG TPA: CocE/NonD family hydrolase, partial [Trichocoleus sp.]